MTNPTHGQPLVQPDDVVSRIDSLIPNEIRALRLENEALRRANAGMVGRAEHARVVGDLTREAERLRARVKVLEAALRHYADDDYNGHNANGSCARAALEAKP
jgi:hypothetical protein